MTQVFDGQDAGAFGDHPAVTVRVERPNGLRRLVVAVGERSEQAMADEAQQIDLAVGRPNQEQVRPVAAEDAGRLAQRQQAGGVGLGDRVVRSLG